MAEAVSLLPVQLCCLLFLLLCALTGYINGLEQFLSSHSSRDGLNGNLVGEEVCSCCRGIYFTLCPQGRRFQLFSPQLLLVLNGE